MFTHRSYAVNEAAQPIDLERGAGMAPLAVRRTMRLAARRCGWLCAAAAGCAPHAAAGWLGAGAAAWAKNGSGRGVCVMLFAVDGCGGYDTRLRCLRLCVLHFWLNTNVIILCYLQSTAAMVVL